MDDQPEPVLWLVLAVPVIGLLVATTLRWVPSGHLMVVTRRGVVTRVVRSGLTLRPPASGTALVPTEPAEVPLVVRADTRDGVPVRMVVRAEVRLVPPTPLERYVDPVAAATPHAERVLAAALAAGDLHDLPARLRRTWSHLTAQADRETSPLGLRVLALELVELDALLGPRATAGPTAGPTAEPAVEPAAEIAHVRGPR